MLNQRRRSVIAQLISVFVFATKKVHSVYFLNPKFQVPSNLLWLHGLVCVGTQVSLNNTNCLSSYAKIPFGIHSVATFTIEMIGNETGHLLKCVELQRKSFNKSATKHTLGRNIDTPVLKLVCENLNSLKSYDKTIVKHFALSLWKIQLVPNFF